MLFFRPYFSKGHKGAHARVQAQLFFFSLCVKVVAKILESFASLQKCCLRVYMVNERHNGFCIARFE